MNFLTLIEAKRDGHVLSPEQISHFVESYVAGAIPDYQMASMLMAIYFRGLDTNETTALTLCMKDSGDILSFPDDDRPLVDKHSTGGVGDKVSLPLAPLLACLGFRVPMISGRGLGITGGNLDKLESIPGFTAALSAEQIVACVQSVGCVICGQTETMVPADKALYALRDATATVPSIPLITASILSKKLAESLDALVLDVKFGTAAFMKTKEEAAKLARAMVRLGKECGVNTRAVLTDMNRPLGRAAGNWLEVVESVACLEGKLNDSDLTELVLHFAAQLLVQTGKADDMQTALDRARQCLESGAPRKKWDEMLVAQGADLAAFNRKLAEPLTGYELKATRSGFVASCNASHVGEIVRDLGGGRLTKESKVDFAVGIDQMAKPGERIEVGTVLARVHASSESAARTALSRLEKAFTFTDAPPGETALIHEAIS